MAQQVGRLLGTYIRGVALTQGSPFAAAAFCEAQGSHGAEAARVIRSAIAAMSQQALAVATAPIGVELGTLVSSASLLGRLGAKRRVPFRVRVVEVAAGLRAHFTAPGEAVPVSAADLGIIVEALPPARVSCITVQTQEMLRASADVVDAFISLATAGALATAEDRALTDYAADGADGRPQGLGFNSPKITCTGASLAAVDADLLALMQTVTTAGHSLRHAAWLMHARTLAYLRSLRGSGGAPAFPLLQSSAPVLHGLPVLDSGGYATASGSPDSASITLVDGSSVRHADDGEAAIATSTEASLEMSDAPGQDSTTGTGATSVSMYQSGAVAIRAERIVNWRMAASTGAAVLTGVPY